MWGERLSSNDRFVKRKEEYKIEDYLKEQVEDKLGGKAYKFIPVNQRGVPDRVCILPGGKIVWIELKADEKEKLRKLQIYKAKQLTELGCDVREIKSKREVDEFVKEMIKWISNHTIIKN